MDVSGKFARTLSLQTIPGRGGQGLLNYSEHEILKKLLVLSGMQPRRRAGPASVKHCQPFLPRGALSPIFTRCIHFLLSSGLCWHSGGAGCFITGVSDCSSRPLSGAAAEDLSGPGMRASAQAAKQRGLPQPLSWPLTACNVALTHLSPPRACDPASRAQLRAGKGTSPLGILRLPPARRQQALAPETFEAGLGLTCSAGHSGCSWGIWGSDGSVRCGLTGLLGMRLKSRVRGRGHLTI